jgi:hypothetical protein
MAEIANNVPDGLSDKIEDVTTDVYVSALSWPCLGIAKRTLMLKNTDSTNALKYKVLTYANNDGVSYEEVAETEITHGNSAQIILEYAYALVVIQVKSSVGAASADYELDYVGNKN